MQDGRIEIPAQIEDTLTLSKKEGGAARRDKFSLDRDRYVAN